MSVELNREEIHPSLSRFKVRFSENQFFLFFFCYLILGLNVSREYMVKFLHVHFSGTS